MQIITLKSGESCCDWTMPSREDAEIWRNRHREEERSFRTGYVDGLLAAIELIENYQTAGYQRVAEIRNLIEKFAFEEATEWRDGDWTEIIEPPRPNIIPWSRIRREIFSRQGEKCSQCGALDDLEIDHIVQVSRGGLPEEDNLRVLCKKCNVKRPRK